MASSAEPKRIFLSPPAMTGRELHYVQEAFRSNYIAPLGPMVDGLEADICAFNNVAHCAALSSGTAALHLALRMLGVGPDDHVICPSFTFVASATPIVYQGATPVFIDSEELTWNMCPDRLEEAIQDLSKRDIHPKALIIVHLYGMPANMDALLAIARRHNIPVIEDAAEALGSRYRNQPVGKLGHMGVFSFNGNKIITTSGGGALVSNDPDVIARARHLATQAREPAPHYQHSEIGYNYRMSNVVAAIGRGQMEALPTFVERCREINIRYKGMLSDLPGITFLDEPSKDYFSNFWLTTLLIDPKQAGTDRESVRLALEEENIESRPLWKPMHLQPVFKEMQTPFFGEGVCEAIFNKGLCLPSGPSMDDVQVERVCASVRKAMQSS